MQRRWRRLGRPVAIVRCGAETGIAALALLLAVGCGDKSSEKSGGLPVEHATAPTGTQTFEISSSAMEPTLHCARPAPGCRANVPDRVEVAVPAIVIERGDVVVFRGPPKARRYCGASGIFVKRVIALPGERWAERAGYVYVNGGKVDEPYLKPDRRDSETHPPQTILPGRYFVMGDNRAFSCDSRVWGTVPRSNVIGTVTKVLRP